MTRLLYVAVAEARGHLMRAHLLRQLLAASGVVVDVVTTSRAGQRFLGELGTPSEVLAGRFELAYDDRQNLARGKNDAGVLRYLLTPERLRRDRRRLAELASGAAFVVDDSFHPALMAAPSIAPVVRVYGENMWRAVLENFDGRLGALSKLYRWAVERARTRAVAHVVHTLGTPGVVGDTIRLPPIIPASTPGPPGSRPRAVIYLNPRFRDPRLPARLERALRGYSIHAIGEGIDRPGWRARDPELASAVAGADLFVSAAGMGALGMVRTFGTPFLCLVTDQPEQRANLRQLGERPGVEAVPVDADEAALATAIETLSAARRSPRADPDVATRAIHRAWAGAFLDLVQRSQHA